MTAKLRLTSALLAMLAATGFAAMTAPGYWSMDDAGTTTGSTVLNSGTAGATLNGTLNGALTKVTGHDGTPNGAYAGFSQSSYIYSSVLPTSSTIHLDAYVTGVQSSIQAGRPDEIDSIACIRSGASKWWWLYIEQGNLCMSVSTGQDILYSIGDLNPSTWYRVGFDLANTGANQTTCTLYLSSDNSLTPVKTVSYSGLLPAFDGSLELGNMLDSSTRYYRGSMDNVTYAVPEPASLALLVLGGLCVLRRRRA